ncbi:two pore domain potassium channel family protein [Paenibacillus albidus]|uniref:potassium channel family protein n=1 Tax=Paenibacillus albidus TaxID=2041023 RepID=UPI001BE8D47F|nr:potassium channel family protein [Paenibacillus albidus]MBT2291967.1 two pore domain potassium channel family protein [Paenibacillus albidus]
MEWWIWALNIVVMLLLALWFYRMELKWVNQGVLLTPIVIYVLISVEDLLDWIDLGSLVPGNGGMRALILFFCLVSVLFYIIFIFHEIKQSNDKEVRLQQTLLRISIAAFSCIVFFTIVYTSIYKLFGQTSFQGENLGGDLLSQLITFLYFSVATFTTVGYGDIAPTDNTSRLVVVMQISFSFVTVAYALSMLGLFRKILGPGPEKEVEAYIEEEVEAEVKETDRKNKSAKE